MNDVDAGVARRSPVGIGAPPIPIRGARVRVRQALRTRGIEPVARILVWAITSIVDRSWTALRRGLAPPHARESLRSDCTHRITRRAVRVLGTLKGVYTKAGQYAAVRHDVLPPQSAAALASLRDRVPALPWAELAPLVEQELGMPIESAFAWIDASPIGAASVAQAHRARLHDGTEVVVKIQYPWIAASLGVDLRIVRRLVRLGLAWSGRARAVPDFDRLFAEFAAGLATELDFVAEAHAAEEIARNLADVSGVVVPAIRGELSSSRVLTMTHHPCVAIDDVAGLERIGAPPARVVEILARAYAKQVFVDGHFHADPHPGNLFVLDTPDAAADPRVLFVDFGLCKRLSPELTRAMREGIYAVLQRDLDGFVARMDDMGMIAPGAEPGVRAAVAAMFERLRGVGGSSGMLGASSGNVLALKDEAKQLLQDTPGLQLPNDLLLYARTLAYLFALGERIDPDVDLMKISIPYLLRFLAAREQPPAGAGA